MWDRDLYRKPGYEIKYIQDNFITAGGITLFNPDLLCFSVIGQSLNYYRASQHVSGNPGECRFVTCLDGF